MSSIIALSGGSKLPAYLSNRAALAVINDDVVSYSSFPVLSIKGKVFTLVKDGERKVLTRPDDPDEVAQSITLTVVRANTKSRVFYAKAYSEDDSEAARPSCYSQDGVAPAADAMSPQANKCQLCPHAVWGSKAGDTGKGTACTVNTRLAVVDPDVASSGDNLEPYLLRVPAGSRTNFADVVKAAKSRGIPYNALALKVGFDPTAPAPKLTFKLIGLADDAAYERINALYSSDTVLEIVGQTPQGAPAPIAIEAPSVTEADLDAAIAAKAAVTKAASKPTPAPAPAPEPVAEKPKAAKAAKAAPAPAPATANAGDMSDLLGELDGLLGGTDD